MTPTISRQTKKPVMKSSQVQVKATVQSRFPPSSVNVEERVKQFREARKAREAERMEKLRDSRLKNSSAAASTVSASLSITSIASSTSHLPSVSLKTKVPCSTLKPHSQNQLSQHSQSTVKRMQTSSTNDSKAAVRRLASSQPTAKRATSVISSLKSRKSINGRLSITRRKPDIKSSVNKPIRKAPKAEVKLTKTAQLRMMKCDPLLELSQFKTDSYKRIVLPLPATLPKQGHDSKTASAPIGNDLKNENKTRGEVSGGEVTDRGQVSFNEKTIIKTSGKKMLMSEKKSAPTSALPSKKKTSFVSPLRKNVPSTPKPSPLRARLEEWLEKNDHPIDNFRHLKCFGTLGPAVKRPQTPFRKALLSTSALRAIPERRESTSLNGNVEGIPDEDDVVGLNSTFTLEDEDKENVCSSFEGQMQVGNPNAGNIALSPNAQKIKELDQAHGVLSELHRLIKMAYPIEQCELWLRAIARRFPQCGDEPIYWECLASLEEIRGDFQSAVACYEQAILQGAETCVQSSLDQLLQKMSELHIEPIFSNSMRSSKNLQKNFQQSSNIIKSSSIQFVVQEKCNSSRKNVDDGDKDDSVYTATPVRRSMRLGSTPSKNTPGITCVRSLEFLEPKVKNSLIFHGNSALEPRD